MPTISADIFGEKEHPALVSIAAKSISPFDLSSDEWVKIDHGIRERAQFMAHVTNADFLQRVQDVTMRLASPLAGSDGKTVSNLDPKTAREVLREAMRLTGYEPDSATGGINPVEFTDTELDFKIRANRDIAWGFADYTHGTKDAEWMQQFPAWELVRIGERKIERDWFERWADAGGELYEGRMIARKDSEIWQALGDGEPNYRDGIGNPYPPFAWNSGMTVEEVERGECENLGVIDPGEQISADAVESEDLNEGLSESTEDFSAYILAGLLDAGRGLFHAAGGLLKLNRGG